MGVPFVTRVFIANILWIVYELSRMARYNHNTDVCHTWFSEPSDCSGGNVYNCTAITGSLGDPGLPCTLSASLAPINTIVHNIVLLVWHIGLCKSEVQVFIISWAMAYDSMVVLLIMVKQGIRLMASCIWKLYLVQLQALKNPPIFPPVGLKEYLRRDKSLSDQPRRLRLFGFIYLTTYRGAIPFLWVLGDYNLVFWRWVLFYLP